MPETSSINSTLKAAIDGAAERLASANVENPRLQAELVAGDIVGCRRLNLYLRLEDALTDGQNAAFARAIGRIASGEPLQYVIGSAGFMGYEFKVDSRTLIPRPETESLVERALECRALWSLDAPRVIDVGTGCGAIAVSLSLLRPHGAHTAADISGGALSVAVGNARRHGVSERIRFVRCDLLSAFAPASFDAVVANLPYVGSSEYERLAGTVRDHEPRVALDGGVEGLDLIARLVREAVTALVAGGRLFLEIGAGQGEAVKRLLAAGGFPDAAVYADLAGRARVASGRNLG